MKTRILGVVAALAISAVVSPAYSDDFTYIYDYSSNTYTTFAGRGLSINDAGQVVGNGFLYSNGNYTPIAPPGNQGSFARDINNTGTIIGEAQIGVAHPGFIYNNGSYTTITAPYANPPPPSNAGVFFTNPLSINGSGQIVGSYRPWSSTSGTSQETGGFLYNNGTFTTIVPPGSTSSVAFGINDSGQIVGVANPNNSNFFYFLLSGGSYTTIAFPGATTTSLLSASPNFGIINSLGQVVGSYRDSNGTFFGFLYSNGTYTSIAPPGATETRTTGINDVGDIVGYFKNSNGIYEGFIYNAGLFTFFSLLGDGIPSDDGIPFAINNSHQILGGYNLPSTPLPAAWIMMLSGLGALGLLGWRRRRKLAI